MEELQQELKGLKTDLDNSVQAKAAELDGKITEVKAAADAKIAELEKKAADTQKHADDLQVRLQSVEVKSTSVKEAEVKSFDQRVNEALLEKSDELAKFERKEIKGFSLDIKAVGDMSTGNVTGGSRYGQLNSPQIIYAQNRKVHMDQILPGGRIGPGNSFTFMRESGAGEGAIATVAEGASKPQLDLDLVETTVQIETIAGFVRFTRKAMTNIPGFISFLTNRLPEKFRRVLDAQILYGNGTTPNLKGILATGNYVASTADAAAVLIEKIITDIAVLEDTYERDANGILLRPVDYYSFFTNKAAGSGEYDLPMGVTFEGDQLRLFGIPVWATTALTATDYVVGDFQNGAQLLTQEAMHIEFFEQDGTNVTTNKITARIEGNYALPVYGPDYFILGDTTVTP